MTTRALPVLALLALLALLVGALAACPDDARYACANDAECGAGRACVDGECAADATGGEGEGDVAEGEGDAGEGEGDAGEGEGEGEPACPDGQHPLALYPDLDNDGFTGPLAHPCIGDTIPSGYHVERVPAPVSLVEPAIPIAVQWTNPDQLVFADDSSSRVDITGNLGHNTLLLTGFACAARPPEVTGLRVRLLVRASDSVAHSYETAVTLQLPGGALSTRVTEAALWPDSSSPFAEIAVGGDAAAFGVTLDAATVCDPAFGVAIEIATSNGERKPGDVDAVFVELLGADDCDDANGSIYSPFELHDDVDLDGHGSPPVASSSCVAAPLVPAAGQSVRGDDCDDGDARAFPGEPDFFTTARASGGYDFNCDGVDEGQTLDTINGCADDGCGGCNVSAGTSVPAACGDGVDVGSCGNACSLEQSLVPQPCR